MKSLIGVLMLMNDCLSRKSKKWHSWRLRHFTSQLEREKKITKDEREYVDMLIEQRYGDIDQGILTSTNWIPKDNELQPDGITIWIQDERAKFKNLKKK